MKIAINALKDFWLISTSVGVFCYILTATCLLSILNFDLEVCEIKKSGIVTLFFAFSAVLAYYFKQATDKFRLYESLFDESLAFCSFPSPKREETYTLGDLRKCRVKSNVRRFSYPISSIEEDSLNRKHDAENRVARRSQHLLDTQKEKSALSNPSGNSSEDYDEIPTILHNCEKDLRELMLRVKLLNKVYVKILEDSAVQMQNSLTASEEVTLGDIATDKEKAPQDKLENAKCPEKNSSTMVNANDLPQTQHRDSGAKEKPKESIKTVLKYLIDHHFWVSLLQNESTRQASGDDIRKFLRKSFLIGIEGPEYFSMKIPSNKQKFSPVPNLESDSGMAEVFIHFYKTKTTVKQDSNQLSIYKKHVTKIPMQPYMFKISMTRSMREISKKHYVTITSVVEIRRFLRISRNSTNEPTVSKNVRGISKISPTTSKNGPAISADQMLQFVNQSLLKVVTDPSISVNKTVISKFEEADRKNFVEVFNEVDIY